MEVIIKNLRKIDHPRIKGLVTIELKDIAEIAGIKVIKGDYNLYALPPNQPYEVDGKTKYKNIIKFEGTLWKSIQEKIIKRFEEIEDDKSIRDREAEPSPD
ncbi:MAG: hypothetical protein GH144_01115 [Clostridia bacterium]|jgi:DNA-binding cell septation regulator SpoVG|nr:hypothetical protein [Clostridia bacterium]